MRYRLSTLLILFTALLLGNVLIDFGLVWYVGKNLPGSNVLDRAVMSILFSQVLLLGFWLALGDTKWYWRLVVTVPATMLVAQSVVWGSRDNLKSSNLDRAAYFGLLALIFLTALVAVFVFLIPLRRLRKWRLTWQRVAEGPTVQQFHIGDLMLWMVPIGVLLAAVHLMATLDQTQGKGLIDLLLNLAGLAAIEWSAMLTAFATRRRYLALLYLVVFTLVVGSAFAAAGAYQLVRSIESRAVVTLPWMYYFQQACWRSAAVLFSFVAAALVGLVNCLILRVLGCQLMLSAKQEAMTDSPANFSATAT